MKNEPPPSSFFFHSDLFDLTFFLTGPTTDTGSHKKTNDRICTSTTSHRHHDQRRSIHRNRGKYSPAEQISRCNEREPEEQSIHAMQSKQDSCGREHFGVLRIAAALLALVHHSPMRSQSLNTPHSTLLYMIYLTRTSRPSRKTSLLLLYRNRRKPRQQSRSASPKRLLATTMILPLRSLKQTMRPPIQLLPTTRHHHLRLLQKRTVKIRRGPRVVTRGVYLMRRRLENLLMLLLLTQLLNPKPRKPRVPPRMNRKPSLRESLLRRKRK